VRYVVPRLLIDTAEELLEDALPQLYSYLQVGRDPVHLDDLAADCVNPGRRCLHDTAACESTCQQV